MEKIVKKLIKGAGKTGAVTLAQINAALPEDLASPEQIESVRALIEGAGLKIVESLDRKSEKGKRKGGVDRAKSGDDDDDEDPPEGSEEQSVAPVRVVADAIASLTEVECMALHGRLRGHDSGSVLDPIAG